jgi:hypothetical protein
MRYGYKIKVIRYTNGRYKEIVYKMIWFTVVL